MAPGPCGFDTLKISDRSIAELKDLLDNSNGLDRDALLARLAADYRKGARRLAETVKRQAKKLQKDADHELEIRIFERQLALEGFAWIAGCDEAGRGALAGPLAAAAVILDPAVDIFGLDDSKLLSPATRESLEKEIKLKAAASAVVVIGAERIDEIGIQAANMLALKQAVASLSVEPDYVLSDAFKLHLPMPSRALIKGDRRSASIAAASILAKVHRDRIMTAHARDYPDYLFESNKGYGSADHLRAIGDHGPCPLHRRSFLPVKTCAAQGVLSFD